MKKGKFVLGSLMAGCLASQAWAGAPTKARMDAIWEAASNRMVTQQDVWFDEGDYPATIQLLRVQCELEPTNYDAWTNLGWMQENVEEYDAALATYLRYRRDNPQDPDNALPLGEFYSRKRLFTKIPDVLEPAIKRPGCHPNNYRILARAYERQDMFTDSIRVWKRYLAIAPNDGAAKANLARVEGKLKKG